jgi:hypothetical protein
MSEKIYALLLRLYPAHFRQMYGEEVLQLVRDRTRDEQGLWAKARLWWDLLADLAMSAPREYGYVPAELTRDAAGLRVGGVPSFWVLEDEPMQVGTWVSASVLSLVLVGAWAMLMDNASGPLGSVASSGRDVADQSRWAPKGSGAGMPQGDSDVELVGSGVTRSQAPGRPGSASEVVIAETAATQGRYHQPVQETNCTFARVEMLPHNVGYLKLNAFPDPAVCKTAAENVMARLNGEDAVIIDLRENDGKYPGMVSLLTGYLFAKPTHLYRPRGTGPENWARPVAGSRLVDKPVYVLTSRATMSAAEQFSYNLKMLKRATLVGEATRGGAHGMETPEVKMKISHGARNWERVGVAPDVTAPAWDALPVAENLAEMRR